MSFARGSIDSILWQDSGTFIKEALGSVLVSNEQGTTKGSQKPYQ
jgi:hypothetical protein